VRNRGDRDVGVTLAVSSSREHRGGVVLPGRGPLSSMSNPVEYLTGPRFQAIMNRPMFRTNYIRVRAESRTDRHTNLSKHSSKVWIAPRSWGRLS
jgi:hypothetical protein